MMCKTQTKILQNASTGKNKMGGRCVATSTEIMTPKTFVANIQDTHQNVALVLY